MNSDFQGLSSGPDEQCTCIYLTQGFVRSFSTLETPTQHTLCVQSSLHLHPYSRIPPQESTETPFRLLVPIGNSSQCTHVDPTHTTHCYIISLYPTTTASYYCQPFTTTTTASHSQLQLLPATHNYNYCQPLTAHHKFSTSHRRSQGFCNDSLFSNVQNRAVSCMRCT